MVDIDRHHLGAVDHHVGDFELAQIEHAADHVAVELLDAAFAVQEIDRAAQFLVRRTGSAGSRRPACRTAAASSATNASIAISIGPNMRTTNCIGRATASATRSGALMAAVFGRISVKTTTTMVMMTVA